jgi:hypothetical protein
VSHTSPEQTAAEHICGHVYWPGDEQLRAQDAADHAQQAAHYQIQADAASVPGLLQCNAQAAWEIQEARAMVLAGNSDGLIVERLDEALRLLTVPETVQPHLELVDYSGAGTFVWLRPEVVS